MAETPAAQEEAAPAAPADGAIIVTARRRRKTRRTCRSPFRWSMRVRSNTGNFNIQKLQQLTPTLQVYSSNPRNTAVNIHGLGVPFGLTSDGFEQGVGIYVDDVYNARVAAAVFDFLDVAQVEVLRAAGHAIWQEHDRRRDQHHDQSADVRFSGKAEVSFGNLEFKQAKAAVSGRCPTPWQRASRSPRPAAGAPSDNVTSDRWINEQDNFGIHWPVAVPAQRQSQHHAGGRLQRPATRCCGTVFVRVGATQRAFALQYEALAAAQNYRVVSRNPFDRLTDIDASLNAGNKIDGASLRVKWDVGGGGADVRHGMAEQDWKPENDRDFQPAIVSKSQNPSQQDQYSQELRYNYSADRFDFVLGAFRLQATGGHAGHRAARARRPAHGTTGRAGQRSVRASGLTASNTQYLKAPVWRCSARSAGK